MELAVLSARINSAGQLGEELLIDFPPNKFLSQDVCIYTSCYGFESELLLPLERETSRQWKAFALISY